MLAVEWTLSYAAKVSNVLWNKEGVSWSATICWNTAIDFCRTLSACLYSCSSLRDLSGPLLAVTTGI